MKMFSKATVLPALLLSLTFVTGLRAQADNIAEVATKAGNFKTLLSLVKAAGLTDALTGTDELTVFAPTDEAFKKVPKKTMDFLAKPENKDKLADLLKYHVVKGKVMAADVLKMKTPERSGIPRRPANQSHAHQRRRDGQSGQSDQSRHRRRQRRDPRHQRRDYAAHIRQDEQKQNVVFALEPLPIGDCICVRRTLGRRPLRRVRSLFPAYWERL